MIIGSGAAWLSEFKGFDERFIERLCHILPTTIEKLGKNPEEDEITHDLRHRFGSDPGMRRLFHFWETQFEPAGLSTSGAYTRDGRIDLVLFWSQDQTCYLAYEAKRLSVVMPSGFQALSGKYVTEGLLRYVTEKYSEGLPFGGMLGYVLDDDLSAAANRINKVVQSKSSELSLKEGPEDLPVIGTALRFRTQHVRQNGAEIDVAHSLLRCCKKASE